MKNISLPQGFWISVLCLVPLLIAGSVARKADAIPRPNPPRGGMVLEWGWYMSGDFPLCAPGQTMGGGPPPYQQFRATPSTDTESIGPCEAYVPPPAFTPNYVGIGLYDADAMRSCLDSYYGTCSYFPGQAQCTYAIVTSDVPFWFGVIAVDSRTIFQTEPVYQAQCWFWYNDCQGLFFTGCRTDFDANGLIDGADLAYLLSYWGGSWPRFDLDASGRVDGADLGLMLNAWGPCSN
jgi:hypothetical protein